MKKQTEHPSEVLEEVLDDIAPCGLSCKKCLYRESGQIPQAASKLADFFGDRFEPYAERFSSFRPEFKNYKTFRGFLDFLSTAKCTGCRNGNGCYPGCTVASCSREKGFDFCYECAEFPCKKVNFDPDLRSRWIEINIKMKKIGPVNYHKETSDLCRYS